jgi:AcrR family transcriptional regulator
MTSNNTKQQILQATVAILAHEGYAGTSMRKVAAAVGREQSVIYTHFDNKENLLRETRRYIARYLDSVTRYRTGQPAAVMMRDILSFQLRYRTEIVALLQYFMAMPADFSLNKSGGYVPERAYEHFGEIIRQGVAEGAYCSDDIGFDARTITHMVNGFLIEYFDRPLDDADIDSLVQRLASFVERALQPQEVQA